MAKELFEDIKTGKKEFLFCWESSSDNEKLKDFLQNSSIIDIEADKIKLDSGFVINIEPNDYFRKMTDNKRKFFIKELISKDAELIITREPLKFKDILIHENKYEVL